MQKSCSNFTFLTLPTTKVLILWNKSPVQVWNYILYLWKYSIFFEILCLDLPEISNLRKIAKDRDPTCPGTSTDLWRKLLDHWYLFKFVHLALKTTWKWHIFSALHLSKSKSNYQTTSMAERLHFPNSFLRERVGSSNLLRSNKWSESYIFCS